MNTFLGTRNPAWALAHLQWELEIANSVIINQKTYFRKYYQCDQSFVKNLDIYNIVDMINIISELPQDIKHFIIQKVIW